MLAQGVAELDYLVVDAVSKDSTREVLKSFEARVRWVSEPDRGQSDAINKGFRRTRGDILTWINADDELAPGALRRVGEIFARDPEVELVYGGGTILDEEGLTVGPFTGIEPFCLWRLTHFLDFVLQPAAFFRRRAFEALGGLDEDLHYTMDWDLWIRLAGRGPVHYLDEVLGHSREYGDTKTSTGGLGRVQEISRLVRRHTGRSWTPGVKMYLLDTLQRGFAHRLPSRLRSLADRWVRHEMERTVLGVGVYADGWHGPRSSITLPSAWKGFEAVVQVPELEGQDRMRIRVEIPGKGEVVSKAVATGAEHVLQGSLPEDLQVPLVTLRIAADASIRPAPDRRRLAFRLLRLDRW